MNYTKIISSLILTLALSACGGGGTGPEGSSLDAPVTSTVDQNKDKQ